MNIVRISSKEITESSILFTLSNDCLVRIFKYLDITDLVKVAEASEHLKKIIRTEIFNEITSYKWDHEIMCKVSRMSPFRVFTHIGRNIHFLGIFDKSAECQFCSLLLRAVQQNSKQINALEFSGGQISDFELNKWLSMYGNRLTMFSLVGCGQLTGAYLSGLRNLKVLRIDDVEEVSEDILISLLENNLNIENLYIGQDFKKYSILTNLKKIKILTLEVATINELEYICELKSLIKLHILNHSHRDITSFFIKLNVLGNIKEFNFHCCNVSTNSEIAALSGLNALTSLHLTTMQIRTRLDASLIAKYFPILEELQLISAEITVDDILVFVESLKNLKFLCLKYCVATESTESNVQSIWNSIFEVLDKEKYDRPMLRISIPRSTYTRKIYPGYYEILPIVHKMRIRNMIKFFNYELDQTYFYNDFVQYYKEPTYADKRPPLCYRL